MPKKGKVGKERRDKFYQLAKDSGYRARSAFKLIQLNRRFDFLSRSSVVIDLCAAPGGWLQVCHKFCPVSRILIGVDLVPIKGLPDVTSIQADITTDQCRALLRKELKTAAADLVLNDGAPNVGQNWHHDAFVQSNLTLSAFRIATEFLTKGGCFITKIFRSKDYESLVWVFKQLFNKVASTKPQASRHASSEIYVVCQGYLAPSQIDPKFFDIKHVFKDIISQESNMLKEKLLLGTYLKKKPKAEGYDEEISAPYNNFKISEFLATDNYIHLLNKCAKLKFDLKEIKEDAKTTPEILAICEDVRVIGKGEVTLLLKWRKLMRKDYAELLTISEEIKEPDEDDQIEEENKEETEVREIAEFNKEQQSESKKRLKKLKAQRRKLQEKMALGNKASTIIDTDGSLFSIGAIQSANHLDSLMDVDEAVDDSDSEVVSETDDLLLNDENSWMKDLYDDFEEITPSEKPKKRKSKLVSEDVDNPLIAKPKKSKIDSKIDKASLWYSKPIFNTENNDEEIEEVIPIDSIEKIQSEKSSKRKQLNIEEDDEIDSSDLDSDEELPKVPKKSELHKKKTPGVKYNRKLTAEELALGHEIAFSAKRRREIIEAGYHKFAYDDKPSDLPNWFVEDEEKHMHVRLPVSKEVVEMYKQRLQEINARPIKKVAEARARKRKRTMKKLAQIKKKADVIAEMPDASEKEKLQQIRSLYKKSKVNKKQNKSKVYVVSKKGTHSKPRGTKGPVKFVDKRLRKDNFRNKKASKMSKNHRKRKR